MMNATAEIRREATDELESHLPAIVVSDEQAVAHAPRSSSTRGALPRFFVLYVAMYAAYGVASPFFPAFLGERGLDAEQLGIMLGAATAVRLLAAPIAARIGDAFRRLRGVLVASVVAATIVTFALLPAQGFWPLLVLAMLHAAVTAPINVLADALAIAHARPTAKGGVFEYGWVRGAGSAAFVAGMLVAGHAVMAFGLVVTIRLQAALLVATALAACFVPRPMYREEHLAKASGRAEGIGALVRSLPFRRLVLVAALLLGSHAMHDAFAVIRWTAAGIEATTVSILWSEAVIAEVLVFFAVGPALVSRLTPAGAIALAAGAGIVRWTVMALAPNVLLLALVEPLHGLTFALFHLAAVRLIARIVPASVEATALAIYGTVGVGSATALLTLVSGGLYARVDGAGFLVMAALSAVALVLVWPLRDRSLPRTPDTFI